MTSPPEPDALRTGTVHTVRQLATRLRTQLDSASPKLLVVSLVASVALLLRDAVVVGQLGLSVEMDGYVAATSAFVLAGTALVSATDSSVVPELARLRAQDPRRERDFTAAVLAGTTLGGLLLSGALWLLAPSIGALVQPGSASGRDIAADVLRWLSILGGVGIVLRGGSSSILTSHRRFVPAVVTPVVGASIVIAVALWRPRPEPLAVAFGVGLIVEAALLVAVVVRVTRAWVRPSAAAWRTLNSVAPRGALTLLSSVVFSLNPVVDLAFASALDSGDGAILATAGRIPLAVAALLVVALVTPQYPRFADDFVGGGRPRLAAAARRQARFAGGIGIAAGVAIAVLAYPVSLLLYSHGEIDAAGTNDIAVNMAVYAATVPFYVAGTMCVRALVASKRVGTVLTISVVGVAVNFAGDALLGSLFGVIGIAAATAVVYAATMIATYAVQ